MRRMKITPGETVGVQGLGGLGHLALQYASKMGYRVVALSSSASKEKFAKDLGASDYVDGSKTDQAEYLKDLGGAGLIVSTAPNKDVVGQLVGGLAPEGKLLILSRKSSKSRYQSKLVSLAVLNPLVSDRRCSCQHHSTYHGRQIGSWVAFGARSGQRGGH